MKYITASRKRRGFTLIELLIGSLISTILLAALYSVYHGLLRTQARSYAGIQETAPRIHAVDMLQKDIENMTAPNGILSGNVIGLSDTRGSTHWDTIEFYTSSGRIDRVLPWGDLQKVSYALVDPTDTEANQGAQLVRTVTRNLLATNVVDPPETFVLFDGVASLQFEYYDGEVWTDSWDSTTSEVPLPKAVRARIVFLPKQIDALPPAPIEVIGETVMQNPAATTETPTPAV